MGRQLSISVAKFQENTNQGYRGRAKKGNVTLEYTTPHMPHLNGVIERIFAIIKEGAIVMLLNEKLHYTAQKMLWSEAVHTCERVRIV